MSPIRNYNFSDKEKVLELFKENVPLYFAAHEIDDLSNYLDNEL